MNDSSSGNPGILHIHLLFREEANNEGIFCSCWVFCSSFFWIQIVLWFILKAHSFWLRILYSQSSSFDAHQSKIQVSFWSQYVILSVLQAHFACHSRILTLCKGISSIFYWPCHLFLPWILQYFQPFFQSFQFALCWLSKIQIENALCYVGFNLQLLPWICISIDQFNVQVLDFFPWALHFQGQVLYLAQKTGEFAKQRLHSHLRDSSGQQFLEFPSGWVVQYHSYTKGHSQWCHFVESLSTFPTSTSSQELLPLNFCTIASACCNFLPKYVLSSPTHSSGS